jgi:hypothetical protein
MVLQLNFETFYNVGNPNNGLVHGLYVYTVQSDVLSLYWNGNLVATTWNATLGRYEFTGAGLPTTGEFTLIQNGVAKVYGYTSSDSGGTLGNTSSIIECGNGHFWFTNDLDVGSLNQPASSQSIQGWNINSIGEIFPSYNLDGTATQGIQQVYDFGLGYSFGQVLNVHVLVYNYQATLPPVNPVQNSDYGFFNVTIPAVSACPTCKAGNNEPYLSSSYSNTCPSTTFYLGGLVASNLLEGSVLEFHSSPVPSSTTKITALNVGVGTYYAVFRNIAENCYSPVKEITITIEDCTPIPTTIAPPIITEVYLCKLRCNYQVKLTGTADFNGIVVLYELPINQLTMNKIIASGIITGGIWSISSGAIMAQKKYIAIGIRTDSIIGGTIIIDPKESQSCIAECVLIGTFKGTSTIQNGIIVVYDSATDLPIATGLINGGNWQVFEPIETDIEYYLSAIKLSI